MNSTDSVLNPPMFGLRGRYRAGAAARGKSALRKMGTMLCLLLTMVGSTLVMPPQKAVAAVQVDLSFFHDRLSPYGRWAQNDRFGWVWYPNNVSVDWRPYTEGRWVFNQDAGWTWDSDEPFGWATYHYGRWGYDDTQGYMWVPGYNWGPAWVAWRNGGGYYGWEALPPEVGYDTGLGLQFGDIDLSVGRYAPRWNFVRQNDFLSPYARNVLVSPERNRTIIRDTTNITNYKFENNRVVNRSFNVGQIEDATHTKVTPVRFRQVDNVSKTRLPREDGINVFSPDVRRGKATRTPPQPQDFGRINAASNDEMAERQQAQSQFMDQRHQQERQQAGLSDDQSRQLRDQQKGERDDMQQQFAQERSFSQGRADRQAAPQRSGSQGGRGRR